MAKTTEYATIATTAVKHETPKAFLVTVFDEDLERERSLWIPKSVIFEPEEVEITAKPGELNVAAWFCKKEGLR